MKNKRGPNIKEYIGNQILSLKSYNPDLSAEDIRKQLAADHPKSKGIYIPSVRGIQNYIKKNADKIEKMRANPIDQPWSMGTIRNHELSPEVILVVLEIQNRLFESKRIPLSIRQVLWASKLYPIIVNLQGGEEPTHFSFMVHFGAQLYASWERFSELKGIPLDTSNIDRDFFKTRGDHTKSKSWPHMDDGYYHQMFSPWLSIKRSDGMIGLKPEEVKNERPHNKKVRKQLQDSGKSR